jgi:hypothetical protein
MCFAFACTILIQDALFAQQYTTGDTLTVVALSGLKLRSSPSANAGTIRVMEYGDEVIVQKTFTSDSSYSDVSGWLPGSWVYVSHHSVSGYVFDVYLSTLDLPSHEEELCYDELNFSSPIQRYVTNHYAEITEEQGREHNDDIEQCVTHHAGGISVIRTTGDGWYKTDVHFSGYRLSEVINLLRSMVVGNDVLQNFEDSMKFYRNKQGQIHRIQAGYQGSTVQIEVKNNDLVHLSMTEFTNG